ncbi:MAG: hypothetical protein WBE13_21725, partial [Candidatus Acidiferrum sp.]
ASFRPRLAASVISPLRFAITSRPSRCEEDLHLLAVEHARHTNIWTGGALPVIVTLLGWITTLKGLFFLILTPNAAVGFYLGTLHYAQFFYFYATFCLVLGTYLTYGGFKTQSS